MASNSAKDATASACSSSDVKLRKRKRPAGCSFRTCIGASVLMVAFSMGAIIVHTERTLLRMEKAAKENQKETERLRVEEQKLQETLQKERRQHQRDDNARKIQQQRSITLNNSSNNIISNDNNNAVDDAFSVPSNCHKVDSWEDVKRCYNGRRKALYNTTYYDVRLIGERNSGTKFAMSELKRCFQKLGVATHRDYTRSKHWFQIRPEHVRGNDRGNYHPVEPYNRVIIVTTHRNPVDWVAAMIDKPYHMLNHVKGFNESTGEPIPMDWPTFVQTPWTYPRTPQDIQAIQEGRAAGTVCSYDLMFSQVTPCLTDKSILPYPSVAYHAHNPVYELKHDGSMEHYKHILELRRDKIKHYVHELFHWDIGGYLAVRYEDLLREGTKKMVYAVADLVGLDKSLITCSMQGPRLHRMNRRKVPEGLKTWVEDNLDYETERLLGYQ